MSEQLLNMESTVDLKKCIRCKKNAQSINSTRCDSCLVYARNWQNRRTAKRLENYECITCGNKDEQTSAGYSRCVNCTKTKSELYFEKKNTSEQSVNIPQLVASA